MPREISADVAGAEVTRARAHRDERLDVSVGERHVELDRGAAHGVQVRAQRGVQPRRLAGLDDEHPQRGHQLGEVPWRRRHHDERPIG